MFGFQRVGDLIWAFADSRGKGFLMGGTAGRTTLSGEGLQHQDGHSPVLVQHRSHLRGLRSRVRLRTGRHHSGRHPAHVSGDGGPLLLHLTVYNENYAQPPMPGIEHGDSRIARRHSKGIYKVRAAENGQPIAQLFGSGPILNEALRAQQILAERYQVADRRVVGDQLQRTAPRRAGGGALEPPASHREPDASRTSLQAAEGEPGPIIASTRLHEGGGPISSRRGWPAGCIRSVPTASAAARIANTCALLRELRGSDRAGDALDTRP